MSEPIADGVHEAEPGRPGAGFAGVAGVAGDGGFAGDGGDAAAATAPLWRLGPFRRFWLGESISFVGNQVTELALPLTAVLLLGASAGQMGALTAVGFLPYLVFGLPAGVWVDRMRRQVVLVALDLISAAAVLVVPLAAALGLLRIELLYVVTFVLGSTVVIFMVAYQSFVPTLVGRERIREANAALEASSSATAVAGPGIGGLLVQWIGAPFALLADGLSFLVSAALVGSIRVDEPPPIRSTAKGSSLAQIREGIAYVASTPALAALVQGGTIHNFFSRMIDALFVLYASRELHLDAATIGLVVAAAGPGAFLGSLLAARLPRWLGLGRTLWVSQLLTGAAQMLVPIAGVVAVSVAGPNAPTAAALVVAAGMVLLGIVRSVFNVNQVSLRLSITPDRMHGRMNASVRFVMWSVTPFGALAGGALASTALGLQGTLFLAAAGVFAATLPFLRPALRGLASMPPATPSATPEPD
ncbi:MAG TPA: MFS transporter [Candidatus Limnocylindrales bacterium]|nr:MFS transporter [Candidatus Limnocylindrales bacterium]